MNKEEIIKSLEKRVSETEFNVKMSIGQVKSQKLVKVSEVWFFDLVSGEHEYDNRAIRLFKNDIFERYGEAATVLPFYQESLEEAIHLLKQIGKGLFGAEIENGLIEEKIRTNGLTNDEPVYVVIVALPEFKWSD